MVHATVGTANGVGAIINASRTQVPVLSYEQIVRGFDGHGERVEDPAELPGALRRALRAVREEGRQAVVNAICRRQPASPSG
jgi:hypothetical protein